ncbi:MAG: sigma 54-interacting transcriptional regulator [Phycisphaeraceae bacterium]
MTQTNQLDPTAAAAMLHRNALLGLVDASRAINGELGLTPVLDLIADHAASVLRAEGASILLLDPHRHELVFQTAVGPVGDLVRDVRMHADQGIAGQAIKTRRAVRVDNAEKNRNFFGGIDAKTHRHTTGLLAAPLIHRGKALGVVEVINPLQRSRFSDADLEVLKVFANLAAAAVHNAQAYDRISKENVGLRTAIPEPRAIGESAPMKRVTELCRKVAASNTTVLLQGETGTGKEMAARAIHADSPRHAKPFIAVNCAALPETLLESELFGHEKGAFTGAASRKLGRFELASGGTLFLDEIGELSGSSQTKLLRVLQEREFTRVGGTETITCDVRILAATNRDLKADADTHRFRGDLYYRLSVFPIEMPPLRQRVDDLPLLVEHFLKQVGPDLGITPPQMSDEAMACLMCYDWPGNIRELQNVVERSALLADQVIAPADLPPEIASAKAHTTAVEHASTRSRLADQERSLIIDALQEANWNQSAAARALGITRDHLRYRIKKYNITRPTRDAPR